MQLSEQNCVVFYHRPGSKNDQNNYNYHKSIQSVMLLISESTSLRIKSVLKEAFSKQRRSVTFKNTKRQESKQELL